MAWSRRRFGATAIGFVLAAQLATAAIAGPAYDLISNLARSAEPILNDDALSKATRTERLSALLRDVVNREDMARSLLGRYWRRASPAQRADLTRLLEIYLIDVYAGRVDSIEGKVSFKVDDERTSADRALVGSRVLRPNEPDIAVTWQVEQINGRQTVTDIVVEGVSLIVSQRADFASVIRQRGGVDGLISLLEERVGGRQ